MSTKREHLSGFNQFDDHIVFLKEFFEKVDFEKLSRRQKSMNIFPEGRVNQFFLDLINM